MVNNETLRHEKHAALIKEKALSMGFSFCGVSKADFLEEEAPKLEQWLLQNRHGKMGYMERNFDKRLDPRILVPGVQSVVSLLYNYYPSLEPPSTDVKISKYAYGEDYHLVIKDKLKELLAWINDEVGEVHGRCFVDSAPVMDKVWAAKAGLGWQGKNTNLITKSMGSFFFVAELIIDLPLKADEPIKDYCGTCTACIDACPTDALTGPYEIDGSKCISYFTIELKDAIPTGYEDKFGNWVFGCDICQDVCPWNRFSKMNNETRFKPNEAVSSFSAKDWLEITEDVFSKVLADSPISRTGIAGIKRNVLYATKNNRE